MIVDQVEIACAPIRELENDPPIRAHRNGPKTLAAALQRVQAKRWLIHFLDVFNCVEDG